MAAPDWLMCMRHVPGTTLRLVTRGGSNDGGNAEATGPASAAGYAMRPGNTLYDGNTTPLTAYNGSYHGPEVGIFEELHDLGFADPVVVIKLTEPGSSLASWNSTHLETLATMYATTGHPLASLLIHGANDATGGGAANYLANLTTYANITRRDRGAGHAICLAGLKTVQPEVHPNEAVVLAAQRAFCAAAQGVRFLDISDQEQNAESHYYGPGLVTAGRRFVRMLVQDRVISVPS